jgi:hypothetical protein
VLEACGRFQPDVKACGRFQDALPVSGRFHALALPLVLVNIGTSR